ncbi:Transposase [Stenotrophomonas acidaminiphila]|uniref:Transposase n=1 Tax=Stenotrophomonas acidaminiphila TaxID=128780 RepID=A0A0S1AX67_9GAMM|nr:Transposase [Stenotrophomonas acidaminiphila]
MSSKRYTDEFRAEAVKQVLERGFTVVDVAARIGIPKHTLYDWVQKAKKAGKPAAGAAPTGTDSAEVRRLKAELRRVTEERDILKKAAVSSTRRRNGLAQLSGWRLEAQGLTRSFVETSGDLVQECLRMAG